jgi:hypothetical protein
MKINYFIVVACIALAACSGGFSKGVKKDLRTGLSTSYNGLGLEDIYLVIDGAKASGNKIPLGKKLIVEATGVDLYKEEQGKVFPGCTIVLTDKSGKELLNIADAFEELNRGTNAAEAKVLDATLNTCEPMEVGQTYILKVRFYDKKNKTSEIVAQAELVMI